MSELAKWDSFCVIVGSAAGTLIGLQFVVMTLIAERPPHGVNETGGAFATPVIVYFATALLMAALLRAPWLDATTPAVVAGTVGFLGTIYALIVIRRMHRQKAYQPTLDDWVHYAALPLVAYVVLAISGFAGLYSTHWAMFCVGTAMLTLLFLGIRNAWDSVLYLVTKRNKPDGDQAEKTGRQHKK
jgi:hypothetical protein